MEKYQLIEDPGHAWLAVPLVELQRLAIDHTISRYSHVECIDGQRHVWLEEDADLPRYLGARCKQGDWQQFLAQACETIHVAHTHIRDLPSYQCECEQLVQRWHELDDDAYHYIHSCEHGHYDCAKTEGGRCLDQQMSAIEALLEELGYEGAL